LRYRQERPSTTTSLCRYCNTYSVKSPAPRQAVSPPIPTGLRTKSGDPNSELNSTGCSPKKLPIPQTILPHGDSYSLASVTLLRDDGTAQDQPPIPHHSSVVHHLSSPSSSGSSNLARSTAGLSPESTLAFPLWTFPSASWLLELLVLTASPTGNMPLSEPSRMLSRLSCRKWAQRPMKL
jgi:hypothetical protein